MILVKKKERERDLNVYWLPNLLTQILSSLSIPLWLLKSPWTSLILTQHFRTLIFPPVYHLHSPTLVYEMLHHAIRKPTDNGRRIRVMKMKHPCRQFPFEGEIRHIDWHRRALVKCFQGRHYCFSLVCKQICGFATMYKWQKYQRADFPASLLIYRIFFEAKIKKKYENKKSVDNSTDCHYYASNFFFV